MEPSGISKLDLKRRNRAQILKLLYQNGPTSRIDLSRSLELTRAAVTIITNEMIEAGVLIKREGLQEVERKPTRGRRKVLIDIAFDHKMVLGAVYDRGLVSVGLTDLGGRVLQQDAVPLPELRQREQFLDTVAQLSRQLMRSARLSPSQLLGLGLCVPKRCFAELSVSPTDFSSLTVPLEQSLSTHVVAKELIDSLALADIDFGYPRGRKPNNLVFVRYRKDITASVIINDEIYAGSNHQAGWLGHLLVSAEGQPCPVCRQRGCISTFVSGAVLTRQIDAIYSAQHTPQLYRALGPTVPNPGQQALNDPALFVDPEVCRIIQRAARHLAVGLVNLIHTLDPERIVVFGRMFENPVLVAEFHKDLQDCLGEELLKRVHVSNIRTQDIYLAGCSAAIRDLFLHRGGMEFV